MRTNQGLEQKKRGPTGGQSLDGGVPNYGLLCIKLEEKAFLKKKICGITSGGPRP